MRAPPAPPCIATAARSARRCCTRPQTLRALVRADEIWLVALSAFVGCGAGILVWVMTETTQLVHQAPVQHRP